MTDWLSGFATAVPVPLTLLTPTFAGHAGRVARKSKDGAIQSARCVCPLGPHQRRDADITTLIAAEAGHGGRAGGQGHTGPQGTVGSEAIDDTR